MQDADFAKQRLDILLEMKQLFDSWDGTATHGIKVIEKNKEHISRAAKELGITRAALYRRLSKHDI